MWTPTGVRNPAPCDVPVVGPAPLALRTAARSVCARVGHTNSRRILRSGCS